MKQTDSEVVIFGVGRSGTTALFKYMSRAFALLEADPEIRYEPFLWNLDGSTPLDTSFGNTAAHSIPGLYAHTRTPMFTQATDLPTLDRFVSDLSIQSTPSLVKFIRVCGRVEYFLNAWPNAKFVYIFRNPCSVINSVLPMFDFFGSEFHKTDKSRFPQETGIDAAVFEQASYPQKQLMYWRAMNDAALLSSQKFPDRILPIAQEALMVDPEQTLRTISDFCFGGEAVTDDFMAGLAGGETPRPLSYNFYNMASQDRDAFEAQIDWYINTLLPVSRANVEIDRDAFKQALTDGWPENADDVKDFNDPDRETGPLVNREKLLARTAHLGKAEHARSVAETKLKESTDELKVVADKLGTATQELAETKAQLATTTQDLRVKETDLSTATKKLEAKAFDLNAVTGELDVAKQKLAAVTNAKNDLEVAKNDLEVANNDLEVAKNDLEIAKNDLDMRLGNALNESQTLQNELAIRTSDPDVRLTFRSSVPRRLVLAAKVMLGKPVKKDRAVLLVPLTYSDLGQVPDQLEWKSFNPVKRIAFYLKCVFGEVISLDKYFDGVPVVTQGPIMMKRNGPFLRRVFSSLKHIARSKVPTRKFSLSYIKLA